VKKILSIVLVLCMLGMGCVSFTSCGDGSQLKVEDLQNSEKQMEILADGADQTIGEFFGFGDVSNALEGMNAGAVTVIVDNAMLTSSMGLGESSATVYFDSNGGLLKSLALEINALLGEQELGGILSLDKNDIAISSETLLGSDTAYKLNLSNLSQNFANSYLMEFASSYQGGAMVWSALATILECSWDMVFPNDSENSMFYAIWNPEVLQNFDPAVKAEQINGKDMITVVYTINNETIASYLRYYVDCIPEEAAETILTELNLISGFIGEMPGETLDGLYDMWKEDMEQEIASLNENAVVDVTMSVSVEADGGALTAAKVEGSVVPAATLELKDEFNFEADFSISATEIALNADIEAKVSDRWTQTLSTHAYGASVKLTREENDGVITINGDVDASMEQPGTTKMEFSDLGSMTITYDTKSGDFDLNAGLNLESLSIQNGSVSLEGNLSVKNGKVSLGVESVGAGGLVFEDVGVTVVIDPNAKVPAIAENATDLLSMSLEEIGALMGDIEKSPLNNLLGGAQ